jgi:hypothetical protein
MFRVKIAAGPLAAVAAALSVACTPIDVVTADRMPAARADTPVRTPLVDDDGWPMPADPPRADTSHAAAPGKRVAR